VLRATVSSSSSSMMRALRACSISLFLAVSAGDNRGDTGCGVQLGPHVADEIVGLLAMPPLTPRPALCAGMPCGAWMIRGKRGHIGWLIVVATNESRRSLDRRPTTAEAGAMRCLIGCAKTCRRAMRFR
jgi:hypothetical protein